MGLVSQGHEAGLRRESTGRATPDGSTALAEPRRAIQRGEPCGVVGPCSRVSRAPHFTQDRSEAVSGEPCRVEPGRRRSSLHHHGRLSQGKNASGEPGLYLGSGPPCGSRFLGPEPGPGRSRHTSNCRLARATSPPPPPHSPRRRWPAGCSCAAPASTGVRAGWRSTAPSTHVAPRWSRSRAATSARRTARPPAPQRALPASPP